MALSKVPIYFGNFLVTPQVFHLTSHSLALVNLKPLLPGHVLVSPRRITSRVADLDHNELTDLILTIQRVGRVIERVFKATSLNIAIQDGADAGQSVPHVHAHIIPRRSADLDSKGGSDVIYQMLDGDEGDIALHQQHGLPRRPKFPAVDNENRKPRSEEEMNEEAEMLRAEMKE